MKKAIVSAAAVALAFTAQPASAALTFVGSWQVDQGPNWWDNPQAYTGQEAAAAIFGGVASNYTISTMGSNVADIDYKAWVSTWGGACGGNYPCGTKVAQNFAQSTGGFYLTPGDTSAYVTDWAGGSEFTNYAFVNTGVPEASTWAMLILGFLATGAAMRSRKERTTVRFA